MDKTQEENNDDEFRKKLRGLNSKICVNSRYIRIKF